jgi:integrase/recombinase XerD
VDKHKAISQDIGMAKRSPSRKPPDYLDQLLTSWQLALRAERKSESTVKVYSDGVNAFLRWCHNTGTTPELDKTTAQQFTAALLSAGAQAATARSRQLALKRFSAWLTEEGEYDTDPLLGIKPPKLDKKVTNALTDDELKRLIKACQGREFRDIRDMAIVRLMIETGMRAGEVVGLHLSHIDLPNGQAIVHRGKGGKGRVVPFSPQTATAIDRYVRARRGHLLEASPPLWVGDRGKGFSYDGLHAALKYRAQRAGIDRFHPHLLRHTAATRWLRAGGSESGLMSVAGWATRDMIDRYTGASASERAAVEARTLGLGEL